jgi:uncharacterized membrane protein
MIDIPIARQVICFLYLTFVPGFMIMNLLGAQELDNLESFLFSIGLSIAFLFIIGLLLNSFGPSIGISHPLSLVPLTIAISAITVLFAFLSYARNKRVVFPFSNSLKIPISILPLAVPPILSIAGAYLVNISGNSSILLLMIIAIAAISVTSILFQKRQLSKVYPLILLTVSIALLFHFTLISGYVHGADVHLEYYVFRITQNSSYWDPNISFGTTFRALDTSRMNNMLSITVLPTIYSNLLNLDATWTLKVVFPLVFSFLPLGLYVLFQQYFEKRIAFVSVLLVMFGMSFLEITTLARQMIGEVFFVLLLIVLLDKKMKPTFQKTCFAIFGFALVTSHYAMALIFLFLVVVSWLLIFGLRKRSSTIFKPSLIALFFSTMFLWYIYTSWSASFSSIEVFSRNIFSSLGEFFNPSSRGSQVLIGIGLQEATSIWQMASRFFAYATEAFIVIGLFAVVSKKTEKKFEDEFVALLILSGAILAMCILLPQFALSLQMTRFLHITLLILAPMFFLGCETFTRLVLKRKNKLLILLVLSILIPYFLFQTNFVYEITRQESWSVPLSLSRMGLRPYTIEFCYVQEQDVFGATWLSKNLNTKTTMIYADGPSVMNVLTSYGMIERDIGVKVEIISNATNVVSNGTIFLSKINVVNGVFELSNLSDISPILSHTNAVYVNGGSEIYTNP